MSNDRREFLTGKAFCSGLGQAPQRLSGSDDGSTPIFLEIEQIAITTDDRIGLGGKCGSEQHIIRGVVGYSWGNNRRGDDSGKGRIAVKYFVGAQFTRLKLLGELVARQNAAQFSQ